MVNTIKICFDEAVPINIDRIQVNHVIISEKKVSDGQILYFNNPCIFQDEIAIFSTFLLRSSVRPNALCVLCCPVVSTPPVAQLWQKTS